LYFSYQYSEEIKVKLKLILGKRRRAFRQYVNKGFSNGSSYKEKATKIPQKCYLCHQMKEVSQESSLTLNKLKCGRRSVPYIQERISSALKGKIIWCICARFSDLRKTFLLPLDPNLRYKTAFCEG